MTKTKRKKRILREQKRRRWIDAFRKKLRQEGLKLGFKTGEEYLLWKALNQEGIKAKHNVKILRTEVDLFIEPNLIVEIGFLDDQIKMKHEMLKKHGYELLYFANLEVYNKEILSNTINEIQRAVKTTENA